MRRTIPYFMGHDPHYLRRALPPPTLSSRSFVSRFVLNSLSPGSGNVDSLRPCSSLTPLCALEKPEGARSNSPFLGRLELRTRATGPVCVSIPTSLSLPHLTLGPSLTNSRSVQLRFTAAFPGLCDLVSNVCLTTHISSQDQQVLKINLISPI